MKYIFTNLIIALIVGFFFAACSELETNIPKPETVSVHKTGIINPSSSDFHGNLVRDNNWNMQTCQQCHAADYSGGLTGQSCNSCHTAVGGPESCNTCHGVFSDPSRIAPPRDVNGNTSTTLKSVGAHSNHLYDNTLGNYVECNTCHKVPSEVYTEGHLDSELPAEVMLGGLATFRIASNAAYNSADGKCSNTYCHGNFELDKDTAASQIQYVFASGANKIIGNNNTVDWTKVDGSQDQCGSCHGTPGGSPVPIGHIDVPITECSVCHVGVIDDSGNILDKTRHINGVIDYGPGSANLEKYLTKRGIAH